MLQIFFVSFVLVMATSVLSWAILFVALPRLKHLHPAHFEAAGRRSWISWYVLRLTLLCYLFSPRFRSLPDRKLASQLQVVKWL